MAVVVEAMNELKRLYPGIRTHFISYRVASWSDTDFSSEDLAAFEYDLQRAGIMPLPLEAIIPRYRFALSDYVLAAPTFTRMHEPIGSSPNSSSEKSSRIIEPTRGFVIQVGLPGSKENGGTRGPAVVSKFLCRWC